MKKQIFILIMSEGEYSDKITEILGYFSEEEEALKAQKRLNAENTVFARVFDLKTTFCVDGQTITI